MNMLNSLIKKSIIFLIFIFFSSHISHGYDFINDREKIIDNIKENNINLANIKLAVIFLNSSQPSLKYQVDLVNIKSEIVDELSKHFLIADPFITSDYQVNNNINLDTIENVNQRLDLFNKLENNHLLLIEFNLVDNEFLLVKYSFYEVVGDPLFVINSSHKIENNEPLTDIKNTVVSKLNEIDIPVVGIFNKTYFNPNPWNYFHPTPILIDNSSNYFIDIGVWFNDVSSIDINLQKLRFDYRYKIFQFGFSEYGSEFGHRHSGYLHGKVTFVSEETINFPLFLALGAKFNYYWNNDLNNNFNNHSDNQINSSEKDLDKTSLYLSAIYKFNSLGLIIGGYFDNLYTGIDGYWVLPYKLVLESNLWFSRISGDFTEAGQSSSYSDLNYVFSITHYSTNFFNIGLNYERRTGLVSLSIQLH